MSHIKTSLSHASPKWRPHARGRAVKGAALLVSVLSCTLLSAQTNAQDYAPPQSPPGYPQDYAPPQPPPGYPQDYAPPPPGYPQSDGAPPPATVSTANYSPEQLDQLLAPIALYPDDLLGQVLMASTYPLEVVQADRWLQNPDNAALRGSALAQALQSMPWDGSVKSMVAYPQILAWMDSSLDWTEATGDAFLAQQAAVMDSVQRLRARAQAAGTLSSTPQQSVTSDGQDIEIAAPGNGMEYVPVYNPDAAYGSWPYPDYPPYGFSDPGYPFGTFIAIPLLVPYWGWDHWDWHRHRIDIDDGWHDGWHGRPGQDPGPGTGHPPQGRFKPWRHDPAHREGVPYRDPGTRAKYEGKTDIHAIQGNYRGYPKPAQPGPQVRPPVTAGAPAPQAQRTPPPMPRPEVQRPEVQRPEVQRPDVQRPQVQRPQVQPPQVQRPEIARPEYQRPAPPPRVEMPRPAPPRPAPVAVERPMPPALESFGRGEEVHVQEQRGFTSRASAPPVQAPAHGGGGRR
jgi:hypothetical protein